MTQDQDGRMRGIGYVVRGEVVPDDETEASGSEQTTPQTRFQKVASARRGDRPDQPATAGSPDHGDSGDDEDDAGAALSEEVGAVRSPDAGNRDDPDDEDVADQPDQATQDPSMTQPDRGNQAGIETEPLRATVGAPAAATASTGSEPTLGDLSDFAYGSMVGDAAERKAQWHQIQFMFVDDPRGSVAEAADVIAQVSDRLEAAIQDWLRAIQERQRSLRGRWGVGTNADTETLRETLRMYRTFLDQLTGSGEG